MKLNEKIVNYFESCDSPVDKEGYLFKKGEIKTSYQKRWCLLKGNLLFYKERPSDRDLIGVIVLEGCTVQLCESEEQFAFSLVWSEPGLRTYKFAAEDQTGQESWIKALLWANHSYLSLLVMDLEKKYRDALRELTGEPANPFVMPKFHLTESEFSEASWSPQPSALPAFPAAGVGTGPVLGSGAVLQASANPSNPVPKKSPKQWAMRNATLEPIPALPSAEWSGGGFGGREDFGKLHEDYGKEVKELIANWSKKGRRAHAVEEDNLIDFG